MIHRPGQWQAEVYKCARTTLWAGALSMCLGVTWAQVNVLTSNYDNERTNANLNETVLNPASVNSDSFGKIGAFPVDGQIYAQPLYVAGVPIPGKGARDVVYVATTHNSVYAIDAGAPQSVRALWQVNLGASVKSSDLDTTDILPEVGILGTPVIDLERQAIFVVSNTLEGVPVFRIHALSLADGHEMFFGPTVIEASAPGTGDGGDTVTFNAAWQLQRPGLALVNGTVYAAFGSHEDKGLWHGWLLGYDASDLRRQVAKFNTTPNGDGGSIWQAGRAPAVDADGNLYVVTANGSFDGRSNFGESFLKLSSPALSIAGRYTPDTWPELNETDADLGSSGAILVPGADLVIGGGKSGDLFLVNRSSMGQSGGANSGTAQSFKASSGDIFDTAVWNSDHGPVVYMFEEYGPLKAFQVSSGTANTTAFSESRPTFSSKFSGIAVSADGGALGTGVVWQTIGNADAYQNPGTLYALDATDLTHELWNSDMTPDRDALGRFAKFVAPTVANGRVYVPTFSNRLVIYGMLSGAGDGATRPRISTVVNSASLLAGPLAPGEIVAIFGAGLGPARPVEFQVDDTGHVGSMLADTLIFFDGVAAPLLHTSSGDVVAVAPFGIPGPTTQIQAQYQGRTSAKVSLPVVPAAPALFSLDGTGGGQGTIYNENGTMNGWDAAAERGSIVTFYGTGAGQTDPPAADGEIAGSVLPSRLALPVTVAIDDQPADVIYAGPAPGLLQGFVQVKARVPDAALSGAVSVVMKVGDFTSPRVVALVVQ